MARGHYGQDKGVRAKKHLGQHFLKDERVAQKIADLLTFNGYERVLEVGPGTGILTQYLANKSKLTVVELDRDSVAYLEQGFKLDHPEIKSGFKILQEDFLQLDLLKAMDNQPFAVVGNFPYNISSQIVFKALDHREHVPEFCGMFQKEVAERICTPPGSKSYGVLSVLVQAYYTAEYSFTVPPGVFSPPPKVHSGVLKLSRKRDYDKLPVSYSSLCQVVKLAFNQRRKTLRNSLKSLGLQDTVDAELLAARPEQLSVEQFIQLTEALEDVRK